ncbi:nucleosome assembly protein, putative [Entamoeba invadens IP1]|uniref:Nucleosome assembly protein, putative n=1 Tax=Entamoeba invadens IP1 TaxID=370355 RepID=A0A0A1U601_ENTIV|nr:nucleosome assembly protein, putative [Entamoeba invadens IP1]ELP88305.1 nucleosome assembly protein, putative [Entamoeba invadens IP1]|eukprot:XP_004255076.1 nucleosome assembly protein, putative [Entamoeba invadens IP1]
MSLAELAAMSYEEYMGAVAENVHKNYHACHNKMKEVNKLRLNMERERYAAAAKFNEESKALYARMNEIVNGNEPTEAELTGYVKSEEIKAKEGSTFDKGIPAFWFCVLRNSMLFDSAMGSEADIEVLLHLKNIRIDYLPLEDVKNREGEDSLKFSYKVHFDFEPNEFFTNETITVAVSCISCDIEGEFDMPTLVTESPIEWKRDKDVRYKLVKKRGGKRGGRGRPAAPVRQKVESFFDLFYSPALPEDFNPEDENQEVDEDTLTFHNNFKIFMELINTVYQHALSFFDESMMDMDDGEDDMDGEDFDEDDEDMGGCKCGHSHAHKCEDDDEDDEDDDEDEEEPKQQTEGGDQAQDETKPPAPQNCPQQ